RIARELAVRADPEAEELLRRLYAGSSGCGGGRSRATARLRLRLLGRQHRRERRQTERNDDERGETDETMADGTVLQSQYSYAPGDVSVSDGGRYPAST